MQKVGLSSNRLHFSLNSQTRLSQNVTRSTLSASQATGRFIQGRGFASCRARPLVMATTASIESQIQEKNEKYPVMIYAKSYCPFCGQVKGLFNKLQVDYMSVNLDEIHEGEEIQDGLVGITGSHTVPQVFIKGQFIGGCDETMQQNNNGKLKELLDNAGVKAVF